MGEGAIAPPPPLRIDATGQSPTDRQFTVKNLWNTAFVCFGDYDFYTTLSSNIVTLLLVNSSKCCSVKSCVCYYAVDETCQLKRLLNLIHVSNRRILYT